MQKDNEQSAECLSHLIAELDVLRKKTSEAFDTYDKARYYQHKKELEIIYLKHGLSVGGFVRKNDKIYKVTKLAYFEPPFEIMVYGVPHLLGWENLMIPPFVIGKVEDLTPTNI